MKQLGGLMSESPSGGGCAFLAPNTLHPFIAGSIKTKVRSVRREKVVQQIYSLIQTR